jgi:parallel beta-helix repeat protein
VTLASDTGINVFDPHAQVTRNIAANNSGSGIKLYDAGALVARNTANDNGRWGIEGAAGTIDGGGNHARGNGQAGQCLNVACSP